MKDTQAARIHITGIVQGVGFRPFVHGLANSLSITGWVRNTSAGVDIVAEGTQNNLQDFVTRLANEIPPLAKIDEFVVEPCQPDGFVEFQIKHSEPIPGAFQPVSPDVSICSDCLRELVDPGDRRHLYPFINCTNCGPRFTIIADIPYDRPNTTMADFPLCEDCSAEYYDPSDRRFHAQPVACPKCGPHVWLEPGNTLLDEEHSFQAQIFFGQKTLERQEAIRATQLLISQGSIVAIKGLGGFHLVCDATDTGAVSELRRRKFRVEKPFAVMMPDIDTVKRHCLVNDAEQILLESRERPIVILRRRQDSPIAREVAPHQDTLGVMLPYTPLHYLLFVGKDTRDSNSSITQATLPPLVMTSGNRSEEPIATENQEARQQLAQLADAFLLHNRPIHTRCDDSVTRHYSPKNNSKSQPDLLSTPISIRRARGYAPFPVLLPWHGPEILATGPELKNTFCLTREHYAFLSQHIGDMENLETFQSFQDGIAHFERLFHIQPKAIAYDLHPNYLATRYALERSNNESIPAIGVQHHHAHVAACMAEHALGGSEPVIGISFDGTGYGDDGAIWGGEFLIADYHGYQRWAHLAYMPLPGGDTSIRKPARIALAYLWKAGLQWDDNIPAVKSLKVEERNVLRSQLEHNINVVSTSSLGRLFDAVASLVGIRQEINYEAQAAIELEASVTLDESGIYPFDLKHSNIRNQTGNLEGVKLVDPIPMLRSIYSDTIEAVPSPVIAARFHNTLAHIVLLVCQNIRMEKDVNIVVLSGGVWQNITLLDKTYQLLQADKFKVLTHSRIPPNDGGIALGQAAVAINYLNQA